MRPPFKSGRQAFLSGFILCFLSAIAAAQQPKAIKGTVKDSTGAIIQGATEFRSGGLKLIAVTDESGHFSIATDLANGTWWPVIRHFQIL